MNRFLRTVLLGVLVAAGLAGCAAAPPTTVRVLTYNIHHGAGMDGRIDLERIAEVIRRSEADIVALQEIERGVGRSDRVDQPARLAELTGMTAVFEKNIDLQGGEYGNAVLSRWPIESHQNHYLPQITPGEQRGVLEVHVRAGKEKLVFFATHFDHRADDAERMASVGVLRELIARQKGAPVMVAGDLNAVPESRVLAEAAGFLAEASAAGAPREFSYPADKPAQRIDYVLFNTRVRCADCRVIAEAVASDHRPVLAVLEIPGR